MLTDEQVKNVKLQIIQQIKSWQASSQQKEQAVEQVQAMSIKELEEFLSKNKLLSQKSESKAKTEKQECPFCLILQGKIPSYKIAENKSSLAILEINPLSSGHVIVLSKQHKKLPSPAFSLANKIAKKLKSKLKPQEVKIESSQILGHHLVNVIPIYKDSKLEKKKAEEKELILLQDKLQIKKKIKKPKQGKKEKIIEKPVLEKFPRRIP